MSSQLIFTENATSASTPAAGKLTIYAKTDGIVYTKNDGGTETPIVATGAITQLTGDVTSPMGPGSVATTVVLVGGQTASDVAAATVEVDAATSSNTPSTLVFRDGSGNFSASLITANLSGNATTSTSFTGSLSGDVTGTQSATVVSLVDGSTAANVHSAELLANASTAVNTASTIVRRDSSGNFAATTVTANLTGTASGNPPNSRLINTTAPIAGGGNLSADLTLSMHVADATHNGYLSSADWNTFSTTTANAITSLTGDVVATGPGAAASTIQANVVSNSKLAQMPTLTLKGNNTGGTANAADLTVSQVNTMLGDVTTIGAIDMNANSNGLFISGNTLSTQSASASNPGMVNNTTQTMSGNKTLTGQTTISNSSTTALVINSTSFVFDATNNALGIGIQPATNTFIDAINSTAASKTLQLTGYGTGSTVGTRGRFARGTAGSPTAAQIGDIINFWSARGYGASQFAAASTGAINAIAGETFTNTSNLTYLSFSTTPTGSVTSAESMRVATTGTTLGPQTGSTAIHNINGGWNLTTRSVTAATLTVDTTTTDNVIYTDSTSNAISITLPPPTNGRRLVIDDKTGQAATNNVTILPNTSEKINGASSFIISQNYGSVILISDGTNWFTSATVPNITSTIPPVVAISASAIDWHTANVFTKTLSANTTFTFSNQTAGQTIVVRLTNTASNYTVTWPTVRWPAGVAPTMTTGAVSDVYTFIYDGSNTYGSYIQNCS